MTPETFAYWLQGFVELTDGQQPSEEQWKMICEHLSTVFVKVTPKLLGGLKYTPPPDLKKLLEDYSDRYHPPYFVPPSFGAPMPYPPNTPIC